MAQGLFEPRRGDLAPGDRCVAGADWSDFTVEPIRTIDHPLFATTYRRLWSEFGASGGMERREVIAERMRWDPARPVSGHAFLYEMLAVHRSGEVVALMDHTVILPAGADMHLVVHLSHVLVEPSMRGRGLAAWLRALPLQTARECAARAGRPLPDRITLVAEMDMEIGGNAPPARIRSFARAGFRTVDPRRVRYAQPDFRAPADIDRTGVQPLPLALVLRRVGREDETSMSGRELRDVAATLYAMYAEHVRRDHMAPAVSLIDDYPLPDEEVALLPLLDAWKCGARA